MFIQKHGNVPNVQENTGKHKPFRRKRKSNKKSRELKNAEIVSFAEKSSCSTCMVYGSRTMSGINIQGIHLCRFVSRIVV